VAQSAANVELAVVLIGIPVLIFGAMQIAGVRGRGIRTRPPSGRAEVLLFVLKSLAVFVVVGSICLAAYLESAVLGRLVGLALIAYAAIRLRRHGG
jgi:hypothetical protein